MLDVLIMVGCLWYSYYAYRHGIDTKLFVLISCAPLVLLIPILPQLGVVLAVFPSWAFLLADYVWVYVAFFVVFFCAVLYLSFQVKRDAGLYNF